MIVTGFSARRSSAADDSRSHGDQQEPVGAFVEVGFVRCGKVLHRLVHGDLLDAGRAPILTIAVAIGIAIAVMRRRSLDLFLLGGFVLWLLGFFGRDAVGVVDLIRSDETSRSTGSSAAFISSRFSSPAPESAFSPTCS